MTASSAFVFDKDGTTKKPTAEELAHADEHTGIMALSKGKLADGRPYWAYIAVKPSLYPEFYRLCAARKPITLDDYGEVLAFGQEEAPPQVIADAMRDVYGFDENFEKNLKEEFKKQKVEFLSKQEDNRILGIVEMLKKQKPQGTA